MSTHVCQLGDLIAAAYDEAAGATADPDEAAELAVAAIVELFTRSRVRTLEPGEQAHRRTRAAARALSLRRRLRAV